MRGLIAYYTKFGNGKRIAEALARGLEESGQDVKVLQLPGGVEGDFDFLIVSSPTRIGRAMGPAKRFVSKLKRGAWAGKPFVAVGTGVHGEEPKGKRSDAWPAGSADKLYERLEKAGLKPLMGPQKFWVENTDDWKNAKLLEGEEDRAFEVGREIGGILSAGR
jgi:flavodoxin